PWRRDISSAPPLCSNRSLFAPVINGCCTTNVITVDSISVQVLSWEESGLNSAIAASKLTVSDLFRKQVRIRADTTAAVCEGVSMSYAELDRRASLLAGALRRRGVVRGDRVAILSQNSTSFLDLSCAAAPIG